MEKAQTVTEWSLDGTDAARWRVPAPGDPDEQRLMRAVVRALGRPGEREIFAARLGVSPDGEVSLPSGCDAVFQTSLPIPARILGLVFDEPAGLSVTSVRVGRAELVSVCGSPVPASLFAATTCAACRDRACQALAGKVWPRVMPGWSVSVGVSNDSPVARRVRAVLVCEDERVEVCDPAGSDEGAPEASP